MRERIVRRDQPEHVPTVEDAELHLVGGDPEPVGHAHRERGRDPGADLDRLRGDGDAAGRIDLDQGEGRIGAAAEHRADAGETDAVGLARMPRRRGGPSRRARPVQSGFDASRSSTSPLRSAPETTLPTMVLPPVSSRLALRKATGSWPRLAAASSIITSSAVMVCNAPKPRIEPAVTARECRATVVDVDLGHVVDADRRGGADEGDRGGEVGEAAAVEILVGGEGGDPAARCGRPPSGSACATA